MTVRLQCVAILQCGLLCDVLMYDAVTDVYFVWSADNTEYVLGDYYDCHLSRLRVAVDTEIAAYLGV